MCSGSGCDECDALQDFWVTFKNIRMLVQVLLFAAAREAADSSQIEVELQEDMATSVGVIDAIQAQYPCLREIVNVSVLAINHAYVDRSEARPVSRADEIALIPPVSGG